ncbi:hypothetical protein VPH35_088739 [Triticum aestivum]
MSATSMLNLERKWIVHPKPRLITLEGGEITMTHEMVTTIFHRLGQVDLFFSKDSIGRIWRKFVEPDFATIVLANTDPMTVQSIRASLQEGTTSCNPSSCRMWYIPAILPDGWTVMLLICCRKE